VRTRILSTLLAAAALVLVAAAPAWAQGTGNGLQGDYYNSYATTSSLPAGAPAFTRTENIWVNFGPAGTFPAPPGEPPAGYTPFPAPLDQDRNSVRWRGMIEPEFSETYTFTLNSDDNSALFINGVQVLGFGAGTRTGTILLGQNVKVPIVVEYIEVTGDARISLEWQSTSRTRQIVPQNRLYSDPAVAAPTVTPNGGDWTATPPLVTLACATPNSTIFYTMDGSDPGLTVPGANATPYTGPFAMAIQGRLRVRAYAANMLSTETLSNPYSPRFAPVSVAAPANTAAGVYWQYYHNNQTWVTNLPNFDRLIPQQRGILTNFALPANPVPRDRTDNFGLRYSGYVQVTTAGLHTFQTDSDEGTKLFIGPVLVVNNDGIHGAGNPIQGTISLDIGFHPITVYYHDATGGEGITVTWQEPGAGALAAIPNARLLTETQAPTPVITPTSATFTGPQNVDITVTGGATIYYTLSDEVGPDARSFTGSGTTSPLSFSLTQACTIRAVAYQTGLNPSVVVSSTVTLPAATGPKISSVTAGGLPNQVVVTFDRAMSQATLANPANYALSNGATVTAATPLTKPGALVGSWAFEDAAAGTSAADGTGNGGTATLTNGAAFIADKPAALGGTQSVHFDGVDDHVVIPDSAILKLGPTLGTAPAIGSFTISLWVNPADNTTARRLINKWDVDGAGTGNARGWLMDINSNAGANRTGTLRFQIRQDGNNLLDYNPNFPVMTAGAWQHLAARVDRQANMVTLFRNGVRVDVPANITTNLTNAVNAKPVLLGRLNDAAGAATGNHYSGNMDEVRIYTVALSDTEIAALALGDAQVASAVRLTTGGTALNTAVPLYTLTTSGLQDRAGTAMDASGASRTFHFYASGGITREAYRFDLFGNTLGGSTRIGDLVRANSYPNSPSDAAVQATPVSANNIADGFGQRFRGWFIPTATGFYRFGIASDDNGQVWVSGDDDPTNKVMVSHCQNSAAQAGYNDVDINQSQPAVQLAAGQKYYIEALYKEGGGNDNCAVTAILLSGAADVTPIGLNAPALPNGLGSLVPYCESPAFTQLPSSRTVLEGEPVTLQVAAGGSGPRTYQWFKGTTVVGTGFRFLIANAAAADAGTYHVEVSDGTNILVGPDFTLTVTALAPTLSSISIVPAAAGMTPPPSGPGAGNQWIVAAGTGLISPWMTLSFGGTVTPTLLLGPGGTSLTAVTPAHTPGTVNVVLAYPTAQSITLANAYTYYNAPAIVSIASVAPNVDGANGPIAGGQPLTITGVNFISGQTTITFGGVAGTITSVPNATTLNVSTPAVPLGTGSVPVVITTPFGVFTLAGGYTYHDPPTLISLSKNATTEAPTLLTVAGTKFATGAGLTRVTFAPGGPGTAVSVASAASLTVTSPANPVPGSITTVLVSVTTPGGTTGTLPLTYYPATSVTGINPAEDKLAGGRTVVISGSNFSTINSENQVTFGSNAASIVSSTNTTISVVVPALGSSPVNPFPVTVTVVSPGGSGSTSFTYYPASTVALPNPGAGQNGGGDTVLLSGTQFSTTPGATTVKFNGVLATILNLTSTSIQVTTPPLTPPGAVPTTVGVVVDTTGGPAGTTFDYYPLPTVDPVTPISPPSGTSQGGTTVTITGTNFRNGQTTVTFGGLPAAVTNVTPTSITVSTPGHDAGAVAVDINAPGGPVSTTYTYVGPRITGVSPSSGPIAGGQTVTITGTGFINGSTTVSIGGTPIGGLTVTATTITFTSPAHAATLPVDVVVTVGANSATFTGGYRWLDTSTVTGILPNRGPMSGGQTVTITGTNLSSAGTTVLINGLAAGSISVAPNGLSLTCVTPAHAPGAVAIDVSVAVAVFGIASAGSPLTYTYVPPPTISAILPSRGPIAGGQIVTITGTNFEPGTETHVVFAGGTPLNATYVNATTVTVATPAHTAGVVTVGVSTFTPPQSSAGTVNYTYVDPAASVDLALTLAASTTTPVINGNVTFTIQVSNSPANNATGIFVTDLLPAGLTFVSSLPSQGTFDSSAGLWNLGTLNASASTTLQIVAKVTSTAVLVNAAEILTCDQNDVDSTPGNGVAGEDDQASVSLTAGLLFLTPAGSIGTATQGIFFSRAFAATGGVPGYTWSITAGPDLPPLNFNAVTGVLSGVVPPATPVQTFTFSIGVRDSAGTTLPRSFSLDVNAPAAVVPVVNTTPAPPGGTVGVAYSFTFTAHDGAGPYTWSATNIPAGLVLNSQTGELAGTPTTVSSLTISVTATNGSGPSAVEPFTIPIVLNPVTIITGGLPVGAISAFYDQLIQTTGGIGPIFNWTISAGAPPVGIALTGTGRVATLTGIPSSSGSFSFTVRVQDGGAGAIATQAYQLIILPAGGTFTATSPTTPPLGTLGRPYSLSLSGAGGFGPYTWTLAGGSLPTGLTLDGVTGTISGTPLAGGSFQIAVRGSDITAQSSTQTININIAPPPGLTTTNPLPAAQNGVAYFKQMGVFGGAAPFTWSVGAGLPTGLTLAASSGAISGTPTAGGASFTVTATDANGATALGSFTIPFLTTLGALTILPDLPPAYPGVPYNATVQAIGGVAPYAFSLVGTAPWLSFDAATHTLSGLPTATPLGLIQVQVSDSFPVTPATALNSPPAMVVGTLIWRTEGAVSGGATPLMARIVSMASTVLTLLARQSCTALAPSVIEPPPTVTMRSALAARACSEAAITASRGVCGGIVSKVATQRGPSAFRIFSISSVSRLSVPLTIRNARPARNRSICPTTASAAGRPNTTSSMAPNTTRPLCTIVLPDGLACYGS